MRAAAPAALWIAVALAGCAGPRPAPVEVGAGPPGTELPARDVVAERLDAARADYTEGVRAWVRDDLETAEGRFADCREVLLFADDSGEFTDDQAREAETLLAKSDYFLGRIDERRTASLETIPDGAVDLESAHPAWEVVHGRIEPARNADVDRWIRYFTGEGRTVFARWLDRRARYAPVIEPVLARHGLPPELTYHAMIESGFNPGAYSWAHAVGLWQFIRTTARNYGLRADWWVDERRDPVRSTEAAARYLQALYEEFGDWELALAAYNVGEARIRRQIRRQGTRDFWKLRLPRETRNHVPKFYAAAILGADPAAWGFTPVEDPPPATETLTVDFCVDFDVLGECAGVSPETLAELNPALVRRCTPPDEEGFVVVVPQGTAERADAALAALPETSRVRWAHHRVRSGDTLSALAKRYRTSTAAIQQANGLRSAHFLSIGQDLLIPEGGGPGARPPRLASAGSGTTRIVYTVRPGDTLSEIAERHGTSARKLRRWNRIGKFIHPGDKLTIQVDPLRVADSGGRSATVRVQRGDTLWDIARRYGVSVGSLLRENNLGTTHLIRPGDLLRIPRS